MKISVVTSCQHLTDKQAPETWRIHLENSQMP